VKQLIAIAQPDQRAVDAARHPQHPCQIQNPLLLFLAAGHIAARAPIADNELLGIEHGIHVRFEPAVLTIGGDRLHHEARRALLGVQPAKLSAYRVALRKCDVLQE
jgi:hypothetical protein